MLRKEERSKIRVYRWTTSEPCLVLGGWKESQIRELCGVKKGLDKRIDEGVLWWFSHVERDRIAKREYVEKCPGCY